jgi:hypothetical protein
VTLDWTAGTLGGTGLATIASDGTLNITGNSDHTLQRELVSAGTGSWTGDGTLWFNSGTLRNTGTFTATAGAGTLDAAAAVGTSAFINQGTLVKNGTGTLRFYTIISGTVALDNRGIVTLNSGTLDIDLPLPINGSGAITGTTAGTLVLRGLTGNTTNADLFNPQGTVQFVGDGTRLLEVMSRDLGNIPAGFSQNFVYGTLQLTAGTNVTLVNNSDNAPGAEALYVNSLIVPAGSTLDSQASASSPAPRRSTAPSSMASSTQLPTAAPSPSALRRQGRSSTSAKRTTGHSSGARVAASP